MSGVMETTKMAKLLADALPMPLEAWVRERLDNCLRIAASKGGADRAGWIEDARYFRAILARIAQ
jgi:hypothetical protein